MQDQLLLAIAIHIAQGKAVFRLRALLRAEIGLLAIGIAVPLIQRFKRLAIGRQAQFTLIGLLRAVGQAGGKANRQAKNKANQLFHLHKSLLFWLL